MFNVISNDPDFYEYAHDLIKTDNLISVLIRIYQTDTNVIGFHEEILQAKHFLRSNGYTIDDCQITGKTYPVCHIYAYKHTNDKQF